MRKLLSILFCVVFAAGAADARTLYVNAKRPNNNGNGLKPSTAKKTIQAAINKARKGDTILVYPGTYAPIWTNDKKITIKSVKGRNKTKIVPSAKAQDDDILAFLSKFSSWKGTNTKLSGFLLDGLYLNRNEIWDECSSVGIWGGQTSFCTIQRLGRGVAALGARLTSCIVRHNRYAGTGAGLLGHCTLQRCKIQTNANTGYADAIDGCKLYNCLVTGNTCDTLRIFDSSILINCTVVGNAIDYNMSAKSKFYNCILRNNIRNAWTEQVWVEGYWDEHGNWIEGEYKEVQHPAEIHNVDAGNIYSLTFEKNENPKFGKEKKGDYRLRKGSPCINKGKLTAAQKKLVGTKDLAGKQRIRGKAIDMGCYEY